MNDEYDKRYEKRWDNDFNTGVNLKQDRPNGWKARFRRHRANLSRCLGLLRKGGDWFASVGLVYTTMLAYYKEIQELERRVNSVELELEKLEKLLKSDHIDPTYLDPPFSFETREEFEEYLRNLQSE